MTLPLRIIVAEDHLALRERIIGMLTSMAGVEVVGKAATGTEALDVFASERPDVVLMDLVMPKMGGLEATRRLAVDPDSPMIILMSIHELSKYRTAALKAGAQYFLAKSELFSELPALMQNLVANRGAQDHWSI